MCVWGSKHLCEGGGGGGEEEGREGIDQKSVRARGRGLDHWEARVFYYDHLRVVCLGSDL